MGVAFLLGLPLFAERSVGASDFPRPAELPAEPDTPDQRDEPLVPVEELHEALQLPKVDTALTDEHSQASLKAYHEGDYEEAFEEAVLSLNPVPLERNGLYQALTTYQLRTARAEGLQLQKQQGLPTTGTTVPVVQKPNGRDADKMIDEALQPVHRSKDPQTAARLNNAAAMMILHFYSMDPSNQHFDSTNPPNLGQGRDQSMAVVATELAHQAADLNPSYCPALLNITLFNGMEHLLGSMRRDLLPAGRRVGRGSTPIADYYDPEGCGDPALLYYEAQGSLYQSLWRDRDFAGTLEVLDRLQAENPEWAGLAHSARGDAYYWFGLYSSDFRSSLPRRPFTAQHYFRLALYEYSAALALQPDDPVIHNGIALAHLGLGEAEEAFREAEMALEAAPDAPRPRKTLIDAYEAKGDFATAARLGRDFLSLEQPLPLMLVPYSPISHGADRYSQAEVEDGGGGGALFDDDVIKPFEARRYVGSGAVNPFMPRGLEQFRELLRHYDLLRHDLASGDFAAFGEDLERAPEPVREDPQGLLMAGTGRLLSQPDGTGTPTPETQAAIDAYLASPQRPKPTPANREPEPQGNDFFYREAANFFRQHEQYENAQRVYDIWQIELEREQADAERRAFTEMLLGETYFLNGNLEEALATFERAEELVPGWPPYLVRQAFIHEKIEEYDRAEELYRDALDAMQQPDEFSNYLGGPTILWPDHYQAAKHRGDMLMRQAADSGADEAQDKYSEAADAYREALELPFTGVVGRDTDSETAASNLALALIQVGNYWGAIESLKALTQPIESTEIRRPPPMDTGEWKNLLTPDEHNPVFRLNLGWAYELNGEPEKAAEEYLSAVKSDPTFFPALNDLGVLAANRGDLDEAKGYFKAALDAKEDYAYANHNLGVALLRSGPWDFVTAQGYLARAAREDPSLIDTGEEYVFDNEIYSLNLSLSSGVPPDWQFASEAQHSAQTISLVALALLIARLIFNFAFSHFKDKATETFISEPERVLPGGRLLRFFVWLRDSFPRFLRLGIPTSPRPWMPLLALLLAAPAIVAVQYWSLLWEDTETKLVMLGAFLCLTLISLLVHNAGHVLAALRFKLQTREAPWPTGAVAALALVAIGGPAFAPVPATLVDSGVKEREKSFAYLAGPLASTLLAVLLYVLFLLSSMPLLRFGAVLNLALAAVSLMALPPLDGASVDKKYVARWLLLLGTFVAGFTLLME